MKEKTKAIARGLAALIIAILDFLKMFGIDFFNGTADQIYTIALAAVSLVVIARAYWKNNSFSEAAILADDLMRAIREDGSIQIEEIEDEEEEEENEEE